MASIRSLLAKWLGGASTPPHAGIRSLLARWLGGAGNAAIQPDIECGGVADIARIRTYTGSGGAVLGGSAVIAQISGAQEIARGGVPFLIPFLRPKQKPVAERKRTVRQTYRYVATGGLELSASAAVSRSRSILAIGGAALSVSAAIERTRVLNPGLGFISSGVADIELYDAIYDTEDEEIAGLLAFAA
jgi:hypothetical protein